MNAFSFYTEIAPQKITPKFISQIKKLSGDLFSDLTEDTISKTTISVIDDFNEKVVKESFNEIIALLGSNFNISTFDDADREDLITNVRALNWQTSYKLFTEVFSSGSKYMTVHQAKGLEWKKVVVSVMPSKRNDKVDLKDMFLNPVLLAEEPAQEFTRIYYVACSRAEEDLYIHLPSGFDSNAINTAITSFATKSGQRIEYEIN